MKRKLIAALVIELCTLAGLVALILQVNQADVPTLSPMEDGVQTSQSTVATQEPTEPKNQVDGVTRLLNQMTLEEKVGQIFLARCPETGATEAIETYHLGGFVLFDRDFDGESKYTLQVKLESYQRSAAIPLLIAVDEEGGTVTRVSNHGAFRSQKFSSPRDLYAQGGLDSVLSAEEEKAQLLASLSINVNLAPVCDISTDSSAFMYRRSLGQSPQITGEFVAGSIRVMQRNGVAAVMKHFPGYGNNADTHVGIAVDERSLETLEQRDLQPFFDGIAAGGNAILVSHTIVKALDSEVCASLSPAVNRYIRLAMGFDGVVITDNLSMDAVAQQYGAGESAVLAILAGNDLLCSTQFETQYAAVLEACRQGRIPEETLDAAVERVLRWKEKMGLLTAILN